MNTKGFALLTALGVALVASGCGGDDDYKSTTLNLYIKAPDFDLVDHDKDGANASDSVTFSDPLYEDVNATESVGNAEGMGMVIPSEGGAENAVSRTSLVQINLQDGTLISAGTFGARENTALPSDEAVRAIVGGTGAYEGARGTITHTTINDATHRIRLSFETPQR